MFHRPYCHVHTSQTAVAPRPVEATFPRLKASSPKQIQSRPFLAKKDVTWPSAASVFGRFWENHGLHMSTPTLSVQVHG